MKEAHMSFKVANKVSIPGKVYVAGEYGVVLGQQAIIAPSAVMLHVNIQASSSYIIESTKWEHPITFHFENNALIGEGDVWKTPIEMIHLYANQMGIEISSYHIKIESDLDQSKDHKYGLGSSGALTIGLIEAISNYASLQLTPRQMYQLGVLSQLKHLDNTSFGDLAVCSYKTPIIYQMPYRNDLRKVPLNDLPSLLKKSFKGLVVTPIQLPVMPISWIHTNESANSYKMVHHMMTPNIMIQLKPLQAIVRSMKWALKVKSIPRLMRAVVNHQALFDDIQFHHDIELSTSNMKFIYQQAFKHQGVCKFSGAGGGDNVMCVFPTMTQRDAFEHTIQFPVLKDQLKGVFYAKS
jgi:phosphomevalonate kinase